MKGTSFLDIYGLTSTNLRKNAELKPSVRFLFSIYIILENIKEVIEEIR
jgi:hypothetical protein